MPLKVHLTYKQEIITCRSLSVHTAHVVVCSNPPKCVGIFTPPAPAAPTSTFSFRLDQPCKIHDLQSVCVCSTCLNSAAVAEVNNHVAQFRDLLIHIGQSRDGPEMREKIRRMRRLCIDSCRHAVHLLLQQVRSDASEGIPADYSPQLVLLFFCTQLLCRELRKCRRLVMTLPIDMTSYYENKPGTSSLGGVLSQIILCRQLNPDFNAEELCSIDKDTVEISDLLDEMQEFMPKENTQTLALAGEDVFSKWARRRRKKTMYRNFGSLCCVSKSGRFTV